MDPAVGRPIAGGPRPGFTTEDAEDAEGLRKIPDAPRLARGDQEMIVGEEGHHQADARHPTKALIRHILLILQPLRRSSDSDWKPGIGLSLGQGIASITAPRRSGSATGGQAIRRLAMWPTPPATGQDSVSRTPRRSLPALA